MADSIDGITVKLSVNSDEFIRNMKQCEGSVDKAEKELSSLEKTTESATKEEQKFGDNVDKANKSLKENVSQTEKAGKKTKDLTDNSKQMKSEFEGAKEALNGVNKILGLFGASVGLASLISQAREFVTETINMQIAYENMYDNIRYISGSFVESQKKVADELAKTFGSDLFGSISSAIGGVSTFFPEATQEQIKAISEELIYMQDKGFGDTATILNQLNPIVKKYRLGIDEIVPTLSHLSKTSMDTGASVSWLLSNLEDADEIANVFNRNIKSNIDFFGDAFWAGNAADVQGLGARFETEFNKMVSTYAKTYVEKGLSSSEATNVARDEVSKLFNKINLDASKATTQSEASQIWADFLKTEVGKLSNVFADMSMAGVSSSGVSYGARNSNETLTQTAESNKTAENIQREIDAQYDNAMANIKWMENWHKEKLELENQILKDEGAFAAKFAAINYDVGEAADNFLWWNVLLGKSDAFGEAFPALSKFGNHISEIFSDPFGVKTGTATFHIEDIGNAFSELFGVTNESATLVNEELTVLSDNIGLVNGNSEMYAEQMYAVTIPALQNESIHVNNLAESWKSAYDEKKKYMELG